MDTQLQMEIDKVVDFLRKVSIDNIDLDQMDPIIKMMLVALIHECQSIKDDINNIPQKMVERFCADFIPRNKVCAMPAIALVHPTFKEKSAEIAALTSEVCFSYKIATIKQALTYRPLLKTTLLPYNNLFILTHTKLSSRGNSVAIHTDMPNHVWVGIVTPANVESLEGLSILIKGTQGICPEHIYIGIDNREINFSTMHEMGNIPMLEPFDTQQSSGAFFSIINQWRECLLGIEDAALLYITDPIRDRDIFKPHPYPRQFRQWLEDDILDKFSPAPIWIELCYPEGYVVPESFEVEINVFPVVNIEINNLTLTPAAPIGKLQKNEGTFFLGILETSSSAQKQGFEPRNEEFIIRDFDAQCYNNADLYRDIRNLYNKFIDNYYAFVEYNGIKDGEVLKKLRETINQLGKGVGEKNAKYAFDTGTYVMKNMNQFPQTSATKVAYVTTNGRIGNSPKAGEQMESKKMPAIVQKADIVVSAKGGADKATADQRYELLRYYTLTNDRLYTKMDIDAFLRKEIMVEFGKEEFKRIFIKINIEGAGGISSLVRGLYIDIEFKDKKNYERAVESAFDKRMKQEINSKSCIAMPIIVTLRNLEKL